MLLLPGGNQQHVATFSLDAVTGDKTFFFQAAQTMLHPEHWWSFLPFPLLHH